MIIVVDEPTSTVKYGSVVAAPYISMLMEKILPYLEYKSTAEDINYTVDNYIGMNINTAKNILDSKKIEYEVIGNGTTVMYQTPFGSDIITCTLSKILLYTGNKSENKIIVPNLVGKTLHDAIKDAINAGLNIRLINSGVGEPFSDDTVIEQSLLPNSEVDPGTVITLRAINKRYED